MDIKNLLDWSYWFYQPFTAKGGVMWFFVMSFLVLILAGLVAKITRFYSPEKWYQEVLRRIGNAGLTMGFLGLLWLFFRQERVVFFAWRFWLLLLVVGGIFWAVKIMIYLFKRVPEIKKENEKREALKKYLPGKK